MKKIFSPVDGHLLWEGHYSTHDDLERAIRCGREAQRSWGNKKWEEKFLIMERYAVLVEKHRDEIGAAAWNERGLASCWIKKGGDQSIEALDCILKDLFTLTRSKQFSTYSTPPLHYYEEVKPIGLIGLTFTPAFAWNCLHWALMPMLMMGNAVLIRGGEGHCLTFPLFQELWRSAGGDPALIQVVYGDSAPILDFWSDHPLVDSVMAIEKNEILSRVRVPLFEKNKKHFLIPLRRPVMIVDRDIDKDKTIDALISSFHENLGLLVLIVGKGEKWVHAFYDGIKQRVVKGDWGAFISIEERDKSKQEFLDSFNKNSRVVFDGTSIWRHETSRSAYWGPIIVDRLKEEDIMVQKELIPAQVAVMRFEKWDYACRFVRGLAPRTSVGIYTTSPSLNLRKYPELLNHDLFFNIPVSVPSLPYRMMDAEFLDAITTKVKMTHQYDNGPRCLPQVEKAIFSEKH